MSFKIAICDDSSDDIEKLTQALYKYDPMFELFSYTSGINLMQDLMDKQLDADILFLDIYMPELDGIQTAQKIRSVKKDLKIVFLTNSKDHYPQAYELFAFNYLIKPVKQEQLFKVLQRAIEELSRVHIYKLSIQYKGTSHNVDYREIQYIESQNRLLLFYLSDHTVLRCYGKLDEIEYELPNQYFLRCHQSLMVNLYHVTEMGEKYFRIGKSIISISKKYWKDVKDRYYVYLFSSMDGGKPQ